MKPLSRRQFLKVSATAAGTTAVVGGLQAILNATPVDAETTGWLAPIGEEHIVTSVCSLCPAGCGLLGRVVDGKLVKLEGNPMHPVNQGALCPKGQASPELLYNPDRLTGPMRRTGDRGSGQWESISWDEAISTVAAKLNDIRAAGHPEQTTVLYGETRGQMRPLIERFMHAVGSPNAISHDSLNIEAAKLAMLYTQGVYDLPAYDIENSEYILSFGANLLEGGRNPQRTVIGQSYFRRGRANRGKIVMIDPRQGITGAKADEWVPIKPGTDAALALGIANVIIRAGLVDSDFIHNYSFGFEDFKDSDGKKHKGFKNYVLDNYTPQKVEKITGVTATTIARLSGEFAAHAPHAIAMMPGKGGLLNGSISGLYAAMAVHILNALIGAIDAPGGVQVQRYFPCADWSPLPADPIAQKGLATDRIDGAGTVFPLGKHAYQSVADQILTGTPVEALFLYDANPVYEAPGGQRFAEAFKKVPFIVSFSTFMDESAQYADLVLPEPTFLERWQDDAIEGMGYPGVGLRQPMVEPLYDTMNTGDVIIKVAQAMGGSVAKAFPWDGFEALLHERLSTVGTDWDTLKELGAWFTPGYRHTRRGSQEWVDEVVGKDRTSAPRDGRFDLFSRELSCALSNLSKEELAALGINKSADAPFLPHQEDLTFAGDEAEFPFHLNVITLMSLGPYSAAANMPTLQEISGMTVGEMWNSWLEMNPETAKNLGMRDKDTVWVESPFGKLKTKMRTVPGLRPDVVNLPHNQGHKAIGRWAKDRGVNGLEIINPASEPATGLASMTNTRVKVYRA